MCPNRFIRTFGCKLDLFTKEIDMKRDPLGKLCKMSEMSYVC